MIFNKLLLITLLTVFIQYCKSDNPNPSILLQNIEYLQFAKDKVTSGDRFGNRPSEQLICIGDGKMCDEHSLKVVVCKNELYLMNQLPSWKCMASLKSGIEFSKTDVICEPYDLNGQNKYNVVKNSCYLIYSLKGPATKFYENITLIVTVVILAIINIALIVVVYIKNFRNKNKSDKTVRVKPYADTAISIDLNRSNNK